MMIRVVRMRAVLAAFGLLGAAACSGGDDAGSGLTTGDTISTDGGDNGTVTDFGPGKDIVTSDTVGDQGPGDTGGTEVPSFFGEPCSGDDQCKDDTKQGYCFGVTADALGTCTIDCVVNCPTGYDCSAVQTGGSDVLLLCVKTISTNCNECETDKDCVYEGARCLDIGLDKGVPDKRCAMDCSDSQPCGDGYQCVAQEPIAGADAGQLCIPTTESCICFGDLDGTQRSCTKAQEGVGTCTGTETCQGADGWSGCTAQQPVIESCNLTDDDCDGLTDEAQDLGLGDCPKTNDFGTCQGANVCEDGIVECSAKVPAEEACNSQDDDCDGDTDEGQTDTDADGKCDEIDPDQDDDTIPNALDNCPYTPNVDQIDTDGDGSGDACDNDCDQDGILDGVDNCICVKNGDQKNFDADLLGNACDPDADGDGVEPPIDCNDLEPTAYKNAPELCDGFDNSCNSLIDEGFPDADADQLKDCLDLDDDGDNDPDLTDCQPLNKDVNHAALEICDGIDNDCDTEIDEGYSDLDDDGICDAIDDDIDGDEFDNDDDNCPTASNADQANNENDDQGDICDTDDDNDSVNDNKDNCQFISNDDQTDLDGDLKGNACDLDDDQDGKNGGISDCNDEDPTIYLGAPEICDDKDNDCNGLVDNGFLDTDGDEKHDCVDTDDDGDDFPDDLDCERLDASINPDALEACDGIDNNCSLAIDEGCPPTSVSLIFPSAVVTGTTSTGMNVMITVGVPGVVGTSAPTSGSGYTVDWGFYYTLP